MVKPKDFMEGFMAYLQEYYGGQKQMVSTDTPNAVKVPLFQEASVPAPVDPAQMEQQMPQQNPMGMAQELNGMFPGPYDPMRLN